MALKSRQSGLSQNAITIKHGSAPEIQAVNISIKKRRSDAARLKDLGNVELLSQARPGELEEAFYRKRPVSKTMTTTKSTMTNDEDYQIEVTKSADGAEDGESSDGEEEEAPLENFEREIATPAMKESQQQKILAWKMTPKVHFPVRQHSSSASPIPSGARHHFPGSLATTSQTLDWQYLPDPIIDPPFEHRPDKTYVIHQNQPIPLHPLKVWPGYGGNLYFEPMRVQSKPITVRDPSDRQTVSRVRSRATSRFTFGDQTATSPDALSDLKFASLPPSSPYQGARNIDYSPDNHIMTKTLHELQSEMHPGDLLFRRKMAHLDKNYVLNMKGNSKLHEDWSWIAGMESIGTLRIGDTGGQAVKQACKPYTRSLVAEKVPRNFVFHPGNKHAGTQALTKANRPVPLVQVKIDSTKWTKYPVRDYSYWKEQSISNWSNQRKNNATSGGKDSADKYRDLKRRLRLPSIPFPVKGKRVAETHYYNPWELNLGSPKPAQSSRGTNRTNHSSRARDIILQSRVTKLPLDDKENQPFSITNWPSRKTSLKTFENSRKELATGNSEHVASLLDHGKFDAEATDQETDDEDKLNYDTIHSAIYSQRKHDSPDANRHVPSTTPC